MTPSLKTGPEPSREGPVVILVTGSRKWEDRQAVWHALTDAIAACTPAGATPTTHPFSSMILRHGGARGLDKLAAEQAEVWGMEIDKQVPDWKNCTDKCPPNCRKVREDGTDYCRQAGFRRNQRMVDKLPRPSICLAFPIGGAANSAGTFDCATKAQMAGLPTWWYDPTP